MIDQTNTQAYDLVAAVRADATLHQSSWEALVPSRFEVEFGGEAAEEEAYSEMARHKTALRRHI